MSSHNQFKFSNVKFKAQITYFGEILPEKSSNEALRKITKFEIESRLRNTQVCHFLHATVTERSGIFFVILIGYEIH